MPERAETLSIVHFPAAVLKQRAKPVAKVDDAVRAVAVKMIELMYQADGIGLAAPQVGLSWRMFVLDVPESQADDADNDAPASKADRVRRAPRSAASEPPTASKGPLIFINPVLSKPEGALCPMEEGCLSLPEIRGEVMRPDVITVTAQNASGETFTLRAGGLLARCIQHEFDHLEGTLIVDRMTQSSRLKVRAKLRNLEREMGS
jgi:peptide deformylase